MPVLAVAATGTFLMLRSPLPLYLSFQANLPALDRLAKVGCSPAEGATVGGHSSAHARAGPLLHCDLSRRRLRSGEAAGQAGRHAHVRVGMP